MSAQSSICTGTPRITTLRRIGMVGRLPSVSYQVVYYPPGADLHRPMVLMRTTNRIGAHEDPALRSLAAAVAAALRSQPQLINSLASPCAGSNISGADRAEKHGKDNT